MAYELHHHQGVVKREFKLKIPRTDEFVDAKYSVHETTAGVIPVVWYYYDGWKIFIAGEMAKRYET